MPDKRMENDVPKPTSKGEDYSGTKMGRKMAQTGIEGMGMAPKASAIPSGTRSGTRMGTNTEGPGVTGLGAGIKHLKDNHSAKHWMVKQHRVGG